MVFIDFNPQNCVVYKKIAIILDYIIFIFSKKMLKIFKCDYLRNFVWQIFGYSSYTNDQNNLQFGTNNIRGIF